jgi:hypothetical protein
VMLWNGKDFGTPHDYSRIAKLTGSAPPVSVRFDIICDLLPPGAVQHSDALVSGAPAQSA